MKMRCLVTTALLVIGQFALAAEDLINRSAYIDVRTGPGRGFPVHHVIERGETFLVSKRRTDWLHIRTHERPARSGWIHITELANTTDTKDVAVTLRALDPAAARFSWAISAGDWTGRSSLLTQFGFKVTPNISLIAEAGQVLGETETATRYGALIRHTPFPRQRLSPYFQLGTGVLEASPRATLAQPLDSRDQYTSVGGGLNLRLARQFTLTLDYRHHQVLTTSDNNEEINEWQIGFSVAF